MNKEIKLNLKLGVLGRVFIFFVLIIGVGLAFYFYVFTEHLVTRDYLKQELISLEGQVEDIELLSRQFTESKRDAKIKELELEKIRESRDYTAMSYVDFVEFIGLAAKDSNVEVVNVSKESHQRMSEYWEIPFKLKVNGEYKDILLFVNNFYTLEKHQLVSSFSLRDSTENLTSSANTILGNSWVSDLMAKVREMHSGGLTEEELAELSLTRSQDSRDTKLDLELVVKFISFESPDMGW